MLVLGQVQKAELSLTLTSGFFATKTFKETHRSERRARTLGQTGGNSGKDLIEGNQRFAEEQQTDNMFIETIMVEKQGRY